MVINCPSSVDVFFDAAGRKVTEAMCPAAVASTATERPGSVAVAAIRSVFAREVSRISNWRRSSSSVRGNGLRRCSLCRFLQFGDRFGGCGTHGADGVVEVRPENGNVLVPFHPCQRGDGLVGDLKVVVHTYIRCPSTT